MRRVKAKLLCLGEAQRFLTVSKGRDIDLEIDTLQHCRSPSQNLSNCSIVYLQKGGSTEEIEEKFIGARPHPYE